MFAGFFIERRVFAIVISLVIVLVGGLTIFGLPIALFPQITPPVVRVETVYTGASAPVVAESVAIPIEQEINGAEGMLYMSSNSSSDGRYVLDVTVALGRDRDLARVDVQNRLKKAYAKLPNEVKTYGITVTTQSPDMLMVIAVYSPDATYDSIFVSNYASINQQTIQQAFREVADSLVGYERNLELRIQKEFLVTILRDAVRLARIRYGGGVSSYLEVLDTETRLFDAELSRVLAAAGERIAVVQLYKALGGGWQVGSRGDGTAPAALKTH